MKRFMLLHFGFEKPTPEIMAAWGRWFESVADKSVDNGGFHAGAREISHSGTRDLPMGMDSITGYSMYPSRRNCSAACSKFLRAASDAAAPRVVCRSIQLLRSAVISLVSVLPNRLFDSPGSAVS